MEFSLQETRQRQSALEDLRRKHHELSKDFNLLRDEYSAVRDCLLAARALRWLRLGSAALGLVTKAKVVSKQSLDLHLSRRRAPRVLKRALEERSVASSL